MENPIKMDDLGVHYFCKHPYKVLSRLMYVAGDVWMEYVATSIQNLQLDKWMENDLETEHFRIFQSTGSFWIFRISSC